jgi:hypothetical protein
MTENMLNLISFLKIIYACGFAFLYSSGGISGKWKRRILGSIILTAGILGFNAWLGRFSLWYLLCLPILFGGLSVGYGGTDDFWRKVMKRARYGFICGLAGVPIGIVNHSYILMGLNIFLCVLVSVMLGVFNPTQSARDEETIIGLTIGVLPLFI